jgi:hypothetical protein
MVNTKRYSAKRALILSAVLPGAGQAYNHKYWKIPVIYGGAGVLGYFIRDNYRHYRMWRGAFIAKNNPGHVYILDPKQYPSDRYDNAEVMRRQLEYYRRNFELSIILMGALYALNIIDANVDAHLKGFQLGNDQLTLSPAIRETGVGLNVAFVLK